MKKLAITLGCALLLLPLFVSAQDTGNTPADTSGTSASTETPSGAAYQFQRQGIFDCNQNGSYAMSIGALSAIGGAYVPVSDAAVELNTGTLVYKECVLREVVDRERESALSALFKQGTNAVKTGRGGNPLYPVNENDELLTGPSDSSFLNFVKDAQAQNVDSAVVRALAADYEGETRSFQSDSLKCPYQGDMNAWRTGQTAFDFNSFLLADAYSQCDPISLYYDAQGVATNRYVAPAIQYQKDQWNWGNGFYAKVDANGNVVTPSSVVEQSYEQLLQSPVQQLQNANDIGQMIGALYAGVTTQVIGDQNGLAGLTQSVGGQPSYLDQVAAESASGLQGAAANAALQILGAAQQVESGYYQAANAIASSLLQSKQQLQSAESQCWAAIIPKVCATPLSANNTCTASAGPCTTDGNGQQTCPTGGTLKVATSTAFSSVVIAAQITPLTGAVATNIQTSQAALQLIGNLITGITNTTSLDAQRVALQQLDTLVAQHQLHTQTDLQTITQQQSAVADTMGSLLQTTAQTWSGTGSDGTGNIPWDGTTNPANGWCNVNNSATLQAWTQKWTQ